MFEPDAVPLPREGEVFFDVRGESRCMRLSWYADSGVAVFSIWQGNRCTGTFRLPFNDLDRMVRALQSGPAGPAVAGQPDVGYLDRDPAPPYSGVHGDRESPADQHLYQAEPWYGTEQQSEPAHAGPGYPAEPAYAGTEQLTGQWHAGPGYPAEPGQDYPPGHGLAEPGYPADPWYADSWQAGPRSTARYAGP